jgi:hypothetical protein
MLSCSRPEKPLYAAWPFSLHQNVQQPFLNNLQIDRYRSRIAIRLSRILFSDILHTSVEQTKYKEVAANGYENEVVVGKDVLPDIGSLHLWIWIYDPISGKSLGTSV